MNIRERIDSLEKQDRVRAIVISTLFMLALLILLFFLTASTVPDPPMGDRVVEVTMADYGYTDSGSGEVETPPTAAPTKQPVEETVAEETADIVEQADSDVSVPDATKPTETQEIVENPGDTKTSNTTPVEEPVEEDPVVSDGLKGAFDSLNNNPGGEGNDDEGDGNEGVENGKIDGKGVVSGDGYAIDMGGRGMVGKPANVNPKQEGTVVLKIFVNSQGKIISSERDYGRSSVPTAELFALAEEAIKTMTFVPKAGVPKQKGFITFNFKLK